MIDSSINFYSLFIFISIILNIFSITYLCDKLNYNTEKKLYLIIYNVIGIIVGAKILTYLIQYEKYKNVEIMNVPMTSYGAVIGIILMTILYCKNYNKNFIKIVQIISPSLPLTYSIGKIGCFIVGCCYGIEYNGILAVTYKYTQNHNPNVSYFPVQLFESIVFLIIYIIIIKLNSKYKNHKKIIGLNILLCGISKFMLDFLRNNHEKVLSSNQIISLFFIIIGIYILKYKNIIKIKQKKQV